MNDIIGHIITYKTGRFTGIWQFGKECLWRQMRLGCAFTFLLSVVAFSCFCQSKEIDSLQNILKEAPDLSPDERGTILIEIGRRLRDERALWYFDQALCVLTDSTTIVTAFYYKGVRLSILRRYEHLEDILLPLIPYAEKARLDWYLRGIYGMLAMHYSLSGQYGLSIECHEKAIRLARLFPQKINLSGNYNDLGMLYYKIRDNEKALRLYKAALNTMDPKSKGILVVMGNLGACYAEMDSLDRAMKYLDQGYTHCRRLSCENRYRLHFDFGYGMVFLKKLAHDSAIYYLKRSLERSVEGKDQRMEAESLVYLCRAYLLAQEFDSADFVLRKAEHISKQNEFGEILLDVYRQSVILYTDNLDKRNLAIYQGKYILQKEAMYNAELVRDLAREESRMVEREHEDRLSSQAEEIEMQTNVLRYQLWTSWIAITIVLLLLFFVWLVISRLRQRKLIRSVLKRRVKERSDLLFRDIESAKFLCHQLDLQKAKLKHELDILANAIPLKFERYSIQRFELSRVANVVNSEIDPDYDFQKSHSISKTN